MGDALDRDETCGSTSGEDLVEFMKFVERDRTALDSPVPVTGERCAAIAGDALDDAAAVGDDEGWRGRVVGCGGTHAEESAGAEFLDPGAFTTIEMEGDAEAVLAGALAVTEYGRIVAADLGTPGSFGSGAVEIFENQGVNCASAVVDANGEDVHHECVLVRG